MYTKTGAEIPTIKQMEAKYSRLIAAAIDNRFEKQCAEVYLKGTYTDKNKKAHEVGVKADKPLSWTNGTTVFVDEVLKLNMSPEFMEMFLVVIQLGAILAVILLYWKKIWPFKVENGLKIEKDTIIMWVKILIACVPAAIVGVLFDDKLNELFYNPTTVAIMLILFGILFIIIENYNKGKSPKINSLSKITYTVAIMIGIFQLIAAVFPGTSRSGYSALSLINLPLYKFSA